MSPIVVDPSFTPPPPPTTVTSSDGHLTATLDPTWAGVTLKADFSSLGTVPVKVAFWRDGQKVRSGDYAWAPGGIAVGYDLEAPLGVASTWQAVPVNADGTFGTASTVVVLTVPLPAGTSKRAWLKCIDQPDLSLRVKVLSFAEQGRDPRAVLAPVVGSPYPVGTRDMLGAMVAALTVRTDTKDDYDALMGLLDAQWLMLQTPPDMGIPPDLYAIASAPIASTRLGGDHNLGWSLRSWTITLTQIDRPATTDSPLLIPGLSWDTETATYASWTALAAAKTSWTSVLGA